MLQRIKDAGLTIRPDKCALVKQHFQYLEFLLGKGVTRPQVRMVDTIRPKSFLGLVGWYRRFIPGFSSLSVPITDLMGKNHSNRVEWTMECKEPFQALKTALQELILKSPDFPQTFTVQTMSSLSCISAGSSINMKFGIPVWKRNVLL